MCIRRPMLWRPKRRDQEDASVPTSSKHGIAEDVLEGCASSIAVSPNFLTPTQFHSPCSVHSGAEAATTSAASGPSSSPFFSARIQSLSERRNDFGSEVEFEIESSKSHWTETSAATSAFDDERQRDADRAETSSATSDFDDEEQRVADSVALEKSKELRVANCVAFEKLKEDPEWGPFFRRQPYELEIGGKIAEGGQAEIYEALGTNKHDPLIGRYNQEKVMLVVKVFKDGFSVKDLQRCWPPGFASASLPHRYFNRCRSGQTSSLSRGPCFSVDAQLLEDGRFAFVFDRYWGDFRKVIDRRMLKSNGHPPFSLRETHGILRDIAEGMVMLHKYGLLHRDLKAANVLAIHEDGRDGAFVADFESSAGIAGTGFWRAPEVLLALKNRSFKDETFTKKSDVYSYAMTCYEVLTGRVPFEGHPTNDYDMILRGKRPPLPNNIYPAFKDLVRKCWHEDPLQRPSFHEIVADLRKTADDVECKFWADLKHSRNRDRIGRLLRKLRIYI